MKVISLIFFVVITLSAKCLCADTMYFSNPQSTTIRVSAGSYNLEVESIPSGYSWEWYLIDWGGYTGVAGTSGGFAWNDAAKYSVSFPGGKKTIRCVVYNGSVEKNFNWTLDNTGKVTVSISPSGASSDGARWRLTSGSNTSWQTSGSTVSEVQEGSYTVNFNSISGWNQPSNQSITVSKGLTKSLSVSYSQQTGSVKTTIDPSGARSAGAQWRLTSGPNTNWQNSGTTLSAIPVGSYTVAYNTLSGWNSPSNDSVTVSNGNTSSASGTYSLQTGSVRTTIEPSEARSAGARWRLTSGPNTNWQTSGTTISNIPVGNYTVIYNDLNGWDTPSNDSVSLSNGTTSTASGNYVKQEASVTVTVKDQNGNGKNGAIVLRYDPNGTSSSKTTLNSIVSWSGLELGNHSFEAYFEGANPFDTDGELWAYSTKSLSTGSNALTLQRNLPYVSQLQIVRVNDGQVVPVGGVVYTDEEFRIKATVQNPSSENRTVRITFWGDRAKDTTNDIAALTQSIVDAQSSRTVQSEPISMTNLGSYYLAVMTQIQKSDLSWGIKTDAWAWDSSPRFEVVSAPPPKPVQIWQTSTGATEVGIEWENVVDPDGDPVRYDIQYRQSGTTTWTTRTTGTSSSTTSLSGLLPATLYDVRVRAYDTVGGVGHSLGWIEEFELFETLNVHAVDAPPPPILLNSGNILVGDLVQFSVQSYTSSYGSALEVRFDYDGDSIADSPWVDIDLGVDGTTSYGSYGVYSVLAQVRVADGGITSEWSDPTTVLVFGDEQSLGTLNIPNVPDQEFWIEDNDPYIHNLSLVQLEPSANGVSWIEPEVATWDSLEPLELHSQNTAFTSGVGGSTATNVHNAALRIPISVPVDGYYLVDASLSSEQSVFSFSALNYTALTNASYTFNHKIKIYEKGVFPSIYVDSLYRKESLNYWWQSIDDAAQESILALAGAYVKAKQLTNFADAIAKAKVYNDALNDLAALDAIDSSVDRTRNYDPINQAIYFEAGKEYIFELSTESFVFAQRFGIYGTQLTSFYGKIRLNSLSLRPSPIITEQGPSIEIQGDLSFGATAIGASKIKLIRIYNPGDSDLVVENIIVPEGYYCGFTGTISANNYADAEVTFSPLSTGEWAGFVEVISNSSSGENMLPASGFGTILAPSVDVVSISEVSSEGARVTLKLLESYGASVSEMGIIIGESNSVSLTNGLTFALDGPYSESIEYDVVINEALNPSSLYFARAYAVNNGGVGYSLPVEFTTLSSSFLVTFDLADNGEFVGGGSLTQSVSYGGSATPPSVEGIDGYTFVGWDAPLTNITADQTISAVYTLDPTYTLSVSANNGSVALNPDQTNYTSGQSVQLTPQADIGYEFSGWSGDVSGSDNPLTITMDASKSITAVFERKSYSVVFSEGDHGSRTGGGTLSQTILHGDSVTAPVITEDAGWVFNGWSPAIPATITSNFSTTAQYSPETLSVSFDLGAYGTRTGGGELEQSVTYGAAAVEPSVEGIEGWQFVGWSSELPAAITADFATTAQYVELHSVSFVLGDYGTWAGGGALSQEVVHGQAANAPTFDVVEGWTFTGWDADFSAVMGDLEITAQYSATQTSILFEDDFSGDLSEWTLWGSPQPSINASLGNPAPSFSNNGDANWDSGAITKQSFDFSNGLVIEADAYQTEFGVWESFVVGLASKASYGSTEGTGASVWVRSHHDNGDRTQFALRYSATETESYDFDDADTSWRSYKIVIRPDRRVEFYKNGELLYTSTNTLSLDYNNLPLIVGGRATSTVLVDNVKVSRVALDQTFMVDFILGDHGNRSGGGELSQTVISGQAAIAPVVESNLGWQFTSWDTDFSSVTADLSVSAQYNEDPTTAPVTLNKNVVRFSSDGGSQSVSVTYPLSWSVFESLDWVSITPGSATGDGDISVTSSANVSAEGRSGSIEVGNTLLMVEQFGDIGSSDYQEWLLDQGHEPSEGHPKGNGGLDGILRYSLNLAKSDRRGVSDVIEMTPANSGGNTDGCMVEFWTNDAASGIWTRPMFSEELGQWHAAESIKVVGRSNGMTKWCAVYRPAGDKCFIQLIAEEATPPATATISPTASSGGSVSGSGEFVEGSTITLTATPAEGYIFAGWSGLPEGVSSDSSSVTFTVAGSVAAVAQFVPEVQFEEDFNANLSDWSVSINPFAPATVETANGEFHIKRSGAGGSGQGAGITQLVDIGVTQRTFIEFDVCPIYSSVRNGAGDSLEEYPIYVELTVEDAVGDEWLIRFAYNYRGGANKYDETRRFIQVAQGSVPVGTWMRDERFILQDRLSDATRITKVYVGARGWDFEGKVDNLIIAEGPEPQVIVQEDFDDGVLDPQISMSTVGTFTEAPNIKQNSALGGLAFGFGRSTVGASAGNSYQTILTVDLGQEYYISRVEMRLREENDWGSYGAIYDGTEAIVGYGIPTNTLNSWGPRNEVFPINRRVSSLRFVTTDITSQSQLFLDDLVLFGY